MKSILLSVMALVSVASACPLPEKAALLASNTVVAKYVGCQDIPCRFMTADCPDRCDHARRVALLQVISNESYTRMSEYGDAKSEAQSMLMVDVTADVPGQPKAVLEQVRNLKDGELVRLTMCHYYAEIGNAHMPIRPVVQLESLQGE